MTEQLRADAWAMPSGPGLSSLRDRARSGRAAPRVNPYRLEHCTLTPGTAALFDQPDYWRAVELWGPGREGVAGYGDTPQQAIADLERITAWRRK